MISIIIPAHNEENYIGNTLKSIKNQNFKDYEVIVVCNGCTDNTEKIAKKHTSKVYNLKEGHVSKARNYGAKKSKYNKLIFLDADIHLTEGTLEKISKLKGFGSCKAIPDNNKLIAKVMMKIKNLVNIAGGSTGFIFCDKELFNKVKFNEERILGEDTQFLTDCKKYSKFILADTYIINNMRRYEKTGYLNQGFSWIIFWFNHKKDYPPIR